MKFFDGFNLESLMFVLQSQTYIRGGFVGVSWQVLFLETALSRCLVSSKDSLFGRFDDFYIHCLFSCFHYFAQAQYFFELV